MNKTLWKRIGASVLTVAMMFSLTATAFASTSIGTSSGTSYFEFKSDSGDWQDLLTPRHTDNSNGNVAYCLEHQKDSPHSSTSYDEFDPNTLMSHTVQSGIQAILEHGYPNETGGFSADEARYATANALRAYLSENGLGYRFMDLSSSKVRPKSGQQTLYDWMAQLVGYGRSGSQSSGGGTITVNPQNQQWQGALGNFTATLTVTLNNMTHYELATPPSGVSVSGYTGNNGDQLTITSTTGDNITLSMSGEAGGEEVTLYWYRPSSSQYQSVVVVDTVGESGITTARANITQNGVQPTPTPVVTPTPTPVPTPTPIPTHKLDVNKVDDEGNPLSGAQFQLSGPGGSQSFTAGSASFPGLIEGSYTLTEVQAPAGYIGAAPQTISLYGDQSVTVVNKLTALRFEKKDALTGAAMAGVSFRIKASGVAVKLSQVSAGVYRYNIGGSDTFVTDDNGRATIKGLPLGSYTIEEVSPPDGYTKAADTNVTIGNTNDSANPANAAMTNEPTVFEFTKTDALTGQALDSATFRLKDSAGNTVPLQQTASGEYKHSPTGADTFSTSSGKTRICYLPVGSYTVEEVTPPSGFMPDQPKPSTITDANTASNPATASMKDEPLTLEFAKTDELSGVPLDGATFRLTSGGSAVKLTRTADGEYKADLSGSDTFTTKSGKAVLHYLPVGSYTIEEVTPPKGFMNAQPVAVEVRVENGSTNPAKASMKDEPLALEFTKVDAFTQKPMDGATFKLLDANGSAVKLSPIAGKDGTYKPNANGSDTFTTKDGKATLLYLPAGKYTVHEQTAAAGYAKTPDKPTEVQATNSYKNPAKLSMQDEPLMLEIRKVDATNGQPISGATFRVTDEDGKTVKVSPIAGKEGYYKADDKGADTFTVDSTGVAKVLYLPFKVYKVIEEKAPAGFAATKEPVTVTVRGSNSISDPAKIDVKNHPLMLELLKVDAITKKPLAGVSFTLVDKDGKTVKLLKQNDGSYKPSDKGGDTFVSGMDGMAVIKYLPVGSYTVNELRNEGYTIANPLTVEVREDNTEVKPVKLTMENMPTKLIIEKLDATNGKPLDGAVFRLLDANGKPILLAKQPDGTYRPADNGTEAFTVEKGSVVITHVPVGKLTLEEVIPPIGYAAIKPVTTELTDIHTFSAPLKISVTDKPLALHIRKINKSNQPLTGAGFAIKAKGATDKALTFTLDDKGIFRYDPSGKVTTVMVGSKADATVYGLPVGEYLLEETVIPEGYFGTSPQKVIIKADTDSDKPFEATVVNDLFVKLGFDDDRFNLPIAIALSALALIGGALLFVRARRKRSLQGA